jgi:hypothetical protein
MPRRALSGLRISGISEKEGRGSLFQKKKKKENNILIGMYTFLYLEAPLYLAERQI